MTKQTQSWEALARKLWEEQAKEQLAELREELEGQPDREIAAAVRSLEEKLERKLFKLDGHPNVAEEAGSLAQQLAVQLAEVKRRTCHECNRPITETRDCATCEAVRDSIQAMYINIERKRREHTKAA